jgi:hypothetical protein
LNAKIVYRVGWVLVLVRAKKPVWAMLVPDCIALFNAIRKFLCRKKTNNTCFHNHTATASAWSHVELVQKNTYPTPKQTPRKVAKTKSNR